MRASRRLPPEQLARYLLDLPHPRAAPLPATAAPLSWPALFGSERPIEIEVGFGKGLFLLNQSQARPDVNFLGIEIERKYAVFTAARLAKRSIANVRLACTDARWLLRTCTPTASVTAVHVYFPDPWWKQRHHKRRVFTADFAAQARRVLIPGGRLHFASDVEAYFDESLRILEADGPWRRLPEDALGEPLTNFERKYREEGRPIFRARFERPADDGGYPDAFHAEPRRPASE